MIDLQDQIAILVPHLQNSHLPRLDIIVDGSGGRSLLQTFQVLIQLIQGNHGRIESDASYPMVVSETIEVGKAWAHSDQEVCLVFHGFACLSYGLASGNR